MNENEKVKSLIEGLRDKYKSDSCVIAYLEVIMALEAWFNPEFDKRIDSHIKGLTNEDW